MAKIELTKQQKAVVENRGGNLLVAAAAGAGKTQVLVDRIMSMVCEEGKNINQFLIITFTRDAAAQLRAKITSKLSERLAEKPEDAHLQKQMSLVYAAQISTVHSFCSNLLHEHAAEAGLAPDFRVGDDMECKALRADVMDDVMEQVYLNIDESPDISAFIDLTVGRDDEAVRAILHGVYDTIQSHAWPQQWADACVANMDVSSYSDAAETPWGDFLMNDVKRYARSQIELVESARALCDMDDGLALAYNDALLDDQGKLASLLSARTWDEMFAIRGQKWARLKPIKKGKEVNVIIQDQIKALRTRYKDGINGKLEAINGDSAEVLSDLSKTALSVAGMFHIVKMFDAQYSAKKQSLGILDYSDLEHQTIRLLLTEDGKKTQAAEQISKQFESIMVDEYQDTNEVQETIFEALSNGTNRFMVGDVKQSIYAFRLADPTIFLAHYDTNKLYSEAGEGEPRKILLTKNFRSRPEILAATNAVMRTCMSKEVGGITYDDNEALVPGRKDFVASGSPVVELAAIDMRGVSDDDRDEDGAALAKVDVEAKYVATRIKDILDNETIMDENTGFLRRVNPGDIAIIMRAAKNSARHYIKALADLGIPTKSSKTDSLMDTDEVNILYCFLQVIDNPYQDIPLVGILASPLFGFTADELANVRLAKKSATSLFEALQVYGETNRKAREFLDILATLRNKVPYTRLSNLYYELIDLTAARSVFGSYSNGEQREANIYAFGEVVSSYEKNGARGLFQFLCYIESLREEGIELPQPTIGADEDAVTVMSTHSSKGLEFPIVFLSDLSRRFNQSNLKSSVLLDRDLGAGVQVYDTTLDYRYPTIARNAIAAKSVLDSKSEELRILYVAMTRAKQKLVMTYCDNLGKTLTRLADEAQTPLPPSEVLSVNCPGQWVVQTALTRPESAQLYKAIAMLPPTDAETDGMPWHITYVSAADIGGEKKTMAELESVSDTDIEADAAALDAERFPAPDAELMAADLSFQYQHEAATKTQSIAAPTSLERKSPEIKIQFRHYGNVKKGPTAAERGTAIHLFLRYADFRVCANEPNGVVSELARMKMKQFLLPDQANAVDTKMLQSFFHSTVGNQIAKLDPNSMQREFRFSVLVPANKALPDTTSEEPVLLSGIVDFFYETEDGIVLYDFKSDYIDSDEAMAEKVSTYKKQLDVYAEALEEICKKKVIERKLVFLRTASAVDVA